MKLLATLRKPFECFLDKRCARRLFLCGTCVECFVFKSPEPSISLECVVQQQSHTFHSFGDLTSGHQQTLIKSVTIWEAFQPTALVILAEYELNALHLLVQFYLRSSPPAQHRRYDQIFSITVIKETLL